MADLLASASASEMMPRPQRVLAARGAPPCSRLPTRARQRRNNVPRDRSPRSRRLRRVIRDATPVHARRRSEGPAYRNTRSAHDISSPPPVCSSLVGVPREGRGRGSGGGSGRGRRDALLLSQRRPLCHRQPGQDGTWKAPATCGEIQHRRGYCQEWGGLGGDRITGAARKRSRHVVALHTRMRRRCSIVESVASGAGSVLRFFCRHHHHSGMSKPVGMNSAGDLHPVWLDARACCCLGLMGPMASA